MSAGGKISATKLTFTLPISCQICMEKVKEPVTCPNQHVFCNFCMEVWLERNKQCPTCRVDITQQSPVRRIIGGEQTTCEEIRSPMTSKHMRRTRMELLFRDYENEISALQREVVCLQHSKDELKARVAVEEQTNATSMTVTKSKCSRCGNMKDIDSMLEMAKNLQEASRTFEQMKEENAMLKQTNEELLKRFDDLKRQNASVKEELVMRSPMKFGRLTVATLESRLEAYEKENSQLNKALENSDVFTASLQAKLKNCSCGSEDTGTEKTFSLKEVSDPLQSGVEESWVCLSGHDYTGSNPNSGSFLAEPLGSNATDGVATYTIENISSCNSTLNENSIDQSLVISQLGDLKSPFTPSTKFSKLTLAAPKQTIPGNRVSATDNKYIIDLRNQQPKNLTFPADFERFQLELQNSKKHDIKAKSFTPQTMPPVESPDYKEKLQQIQGNLLHPITSSARSPGIGQGRSFSRKLTFDDTLQAMNKPETFDLKFLEENTMSSCREDFLTMLPNEDNMQSAEYEKQSLSKIHNESHLLHPHSVFHCDESHFRVSNELIHGSSNPILSENYLADDNARGKQGKDLPHQVSLSVVKAGGSRITTTKLLKSDRDIFSRPSSAPSRTFLLSGSRFSALRPLGGLSHFQPGKCKSPSPLSVTKLQHTQQSRRAITSKNEGTRCIVDGRPASPMLKLVSPDEVIGTSWKQTTCHSRSSSGDDSSHATSTNKAKETISRIAILKHHSSGKPTYTMNPDLMRSPSVSASIHSDNSGNSTSRKSSRKQRLNDPNSKRIGDHLLEFVSPIKSQKIEHK